MVDLNNPDDSRGIARGINNSGQIVGSYTPSGSSAPRAFRYSGTPGSDGMRFDLGTLGGPTSIGYGISPNGLVTGWSLTPTPPVFGVAGNHAFLYSGTPGVNGKMTDLGTLGGQESYGVGVNDGGQVVGNANTASAALHAFLYTGTPGAGGKMYDLGTFGRESSALAINASGQVVGVSELPNGIPHAFLYTGTPGTDGHMIDLDAWLKATDPDDGARWTLNGAYALTDSGLVTGYGTHYDADGLSFGQQSFLLDASPLVPEAQSPCWE